MTDTTSPTLSSQEIYDITHYRRQAEQLRALAALGIPATRRHDNTVCVLRVDLQVQRGKTDQKRPQLRL